MENVKRAQDLIGSELYDRDGNRIGRVGNVYVDDSTQQPEWVTVRTGMFGTRESFVPLQNASAEHNRVSVDVSREKVRDAPAVEAEQGHLSDSEGRDLYDYYGLRRPSTGQQGTSAPEMEEAEAEEAQAQAAPQQRGAEETGTAAAAGTTQERPRETAAPRETTEAAQRTDTSEAERWGTRESTSAPQMLTRYEERLRVGTETVETGRVRLRKYIVTERESATVPLSHEEVRIEREPIPESERSSMTGGELGETEQEVVLREERPVLTTEQVPVERLRISTETVTEERTVHGDVRREQFDIEDKTGKPAGGQQD